MPDDTGNTLCALLYFVLSGIFGDFRFCATAAQKVCHLLGINVTEFTRAILSPRIKVCIVIQKYWKEKHEMKPLATGLMLF